MLLDVTDDQAAELLAEQRWCDGVRCAHCGSPRVAQRTRAGRRWPQWRCRDCRKEFTATTGTSLHGTRRSPSEALAGLGGKTDAAWVSRRGRNADSGGKRSARLASRGSLAVFTALRRRPDGATAAKIADLADITTTHARRLLRRFENDGIAHVKEGPVRNGHRTVFKPLWSLTYSPRCMRTMRDNPPCPIKRYKCPVEGVVPPQFWHLFWSGMQGSELRLPDHELLVAGNCIGSVDIAAECWALKNVSTEALETLAVSRGYDTGDVNRRIRSELRWRAKRHAAT